MELLRRYLKEKREGGKNSLFTERGMYYLFSVFPFFSTNIENLDYCYYLNNYNDEKNDDY